MNSVLTSLGHIWQLGLKELRSLWRDRLLLLFVIWAFSGALYTAAKAAPDRLHRAAIAVVDEDQSPLSQRIVNAFYPPTFMKPTAIGLQDMDAGMDAGRFTFVMDIPPDFQSDVLAGKQPSIQLNVDATQMSQAFLGASYIQSIALGEVAEYLAGDRVVSTPVVDLAIRNRFNPALDNTWFMGVMELINNVTMLSIVLTGAALIREREHGTIEHLLVLPVKPSEIMLAKVWAMGAVVLLATALALQFVLRDALQMPVSGSIGLFLTGCALHLFATTSMGIYLGTVARSMPQMGLLMILVLLPLQILSGGMTPRESMPDLVRYLMMGAPTTHFVSFAQAILYRGADLSIVWPQFAAIGLIGTAFFVAALKRFRSTVSSMQS
ncbi:MAG: ABC transporter permease [Aquabacterium sp.]|jgi:ABC-2 type transport system permease protein|uniref:ABC transporter permease n=1 Tax=Aquabacterium sp. TaxID=1872578 RepID=UPI002A35B1D6|nr:ABC transporter permease [Aquabacterium sp.]MDX9844304.1 ABC transporter permease [Aquabacterium sp.]